MEELLQYAAELNGEGASCLASHNSCAAFEYFRNTLELLLIYNPQCQEILASSPSLHASAHSLLLLPMAYHALLADNNMHGFEQGSSTTPIRPPALTTAHHHAHTHLFSTAFVFQPKEDQEREDHIRIRTYIAILFFNMATTIHQRGCTNEEDESLCMGVGGSGSGGVWNNGHGKHALRIALQLYDVGFDLLIQEESSCMDDWSTNINLACLHNMSQCHYALSDFAKATRFLDLQKGLLEIIISNKRPHNFSEQEMELFILNTHLLQRPSAASAA